MAGGKRHEDEEKGLERALFSMGKESNEAGQVYYHDVRQAAGKKRKNLILRQTLTTI